MTPKELGIWGEKIACFYLKKKGYKILEKNYYKEQTAILKGEIDIVAKKGGAISFVEVKTITQPAFGGLGYLPEFKVDFQKQRKLKKLAEKWLSENKIPLDSQWQIDVVSVKINTPENKAKIQHFENIVQD